MTVISGYTIIVDGLGNTVTFDVHKTGGWTTVDATYVELDITGDTTDIEVANTIRTAIGATALDFTVDAPGAALIEITHDTTGKAGRDAEITYTPAAAGTGLAITTPFTLPWFTVALVRP